MTTRSCTDGCGWESYFIEIPAAEASAGISCEYLDVRPMWSGNEEGSGGLHRPPNGGACNPGLVSITTGVGDVCAKSCTEDSDCSLPDVLSCQEQACRLTEPWVDGND